jgi:hypothetical protein
MRRASNPQRYGRCELVRDHEGDHALEHGMSVTRWGDGPVYETAADDVLGLGPDDERNTTR